MRTHKAQTEALASSSSQPLPCFSLSSRKNKKRMVQGKVRIRSLPGAFLVLGMMVVIVGTTLAVVGYWPYRLQRSGVGSLSRGLSQGPNWGLGAKGQFSTMSLIHTDRMKLVGPVIMGVGLFIVICANTVLYENRDKETQILLSEMQSVMCTMSSVPSTDFTQVSSLIRQYHWVSSLPAAHLNILCLKELASSDDPLLQVKASKKERMSLQTEVMHTEILCHQESLFINSIHLSDALNSNEGDISTYLDVEKGRVCGHQPQSKSRCSLTKCFTSSFMSAREEIATVPPRRSYSMGYRTSSQTMPRSSVHLEEKSVQNTRCRKQFPQSCLSEACVNQPGSSAKPLDFDLAAVEDQKHHSLP